MLFADIFSSCLGITDFTKENIIDLCQQAGMVVENGKIINAKGQDIDSNNNISDMQDILNSAKDNEVSNQTSSLEQDAEEKLNINKESKIEEAVKGSSFSIPKPADISNVNNSKLEPNKKVEGIMFKNKKPKVASLASTESAKDAHYSSKADYPNTTSHIDGLGNFIKINKKTGQVDIAHFSGTLIQITKTGSVNIHTKKDLRHIVEGNYYLEVAGDMGIKASNINVLANNKKENIKSNYNIKTKNLMIKDEISVETSKTKAINTGTLSESFKAKTSSSSGYSESVKGGVKVEKGNGLKQNIPNIAIKGNQQVTGNIEVAGDVHANNLRYR